MSCLRIYQDNYIDATIVSNRFIDEYMAEANDAQLKIYLYLLRMMNAGRTFSISGIADAFNHTEKDVMRALKYWEKCKVLSLEYDNEKNLVGIHLLELENKEEPAVSKAPRSFSAAPGRRRKTRKRKFSRKRPKPKVRPLMLCSLLPRKEISPLRLPRRRLPSLPTPWTS